MPRRAFTLVEAMVVMGIIAILGGILIAALHHVKGSGDAMDERAMVLAFRNSVESYQQKFNSFPPLVDDSMPPDAAGKIYVWTTRDLYDPNTTKNASTGPTDRHCWSQYSIPYFLLGSLDELYDGITGPGFTAPNASPNNTDGTFSFTKRGRKFDPLVDISAKKTRSGVLRLMIPNVSGTAATNQAARARCVVLDRWSDGSADVHPIRYYRWSPTYYTEAGGPDPAPSADKVGKIHYWNVPVAVGGNPDNITPPANPALRDAQYAIVSAGPDRDFGDADPAKAADNIVEVGK